MKSSLVNLYTIKDNWVTREHRGTGEINFTIMTSNIHNIDRRTLHTLFFIFDYFEVFIETITNLTYLTQSALPGNRLQSKNNKQSLPELE